MVCHQKFTFSLFEWQINRSIVAGRMVNLIWVYNVWTLRCECIFSFCRFKREFFTWICVFSIQIDDLYGIYSLPWLCTRENRKNHSNCRWHTVQTNKETHNNIRSGCLHRSTKAIFRKLLDTPICSIDFYDCHIKWSSVPIEAVQVFWMCTILRECRCNDVYYYFYWGVFLFTSNRICRHIQFYWYFTLSR